MENRQNERQDDRIDGSEAKMTSPFIKRMENFFYHYKWHTIIAVFLIFTVVLCSFQMCQKVEYDLYVLYAGSENIAITASDGEQSEHEKLVSAIKQYASDKNGDGSKQVSLKNLYLPTTTDGSFNPDLDISQSLVVENRREFDDTLMVGDYYLCFLSEHLFDEVTEGEICFMLPIAPYATGGKYEYASEYGIYLSSTPLYEKAGFSLLPEDTVICIRARSTIFNSASQEERFLAAEQALRALLG